MDKLDNIDNSFESYQKLIGFYEKHKNQSFEEITINLHKWFAANMCSALAGIFELLQNNLNEIQLIEIPPNIQTILQKNNFLSYYGKSGIVDSNHTTIPFCKLKKTDGRYFKNYIFEELLGKDELPDMTQAVKNKIAEAIYEIFVNAQIHSETNYIFTCGQFYPNKHKIEFTVTDIGIGFKQKVNQSFNKQLSAIQAIKWAVKDRHTTKKGTPGGIGLAFLQEFILHNKGKMQIISSDGFYEYENGRETVKTFKGEYPGTVVNLQFMTNDKQIYYLPEEVDINNLF